MRSVFLVLAALAFPGGVAFLVAEDTAGPAAREATPWAGVYFKFARYDTDRRGQFGEARQVTITRDADGYYLSKPYDGRRFTEVEKGVLSDGKGGLGRLYLGTAEFADGKRVRVLRAEFCYEHFVLYARPDESAK